MASNLSESKLSGYTDQYEYNISTVLRLLPYLSDREDWLTVQVGADAKSLTNAQRATDGLAAMADISIAFAELAPEHKRGVLEYTLFGDEDSASLSALVDVMNGG